MLALGGLVVGLLLSEVPARLLLPAPPFPDREPQIEYQPDPDVGYLHAPSQQGWIDDGSMSVNSLGFRGEEPALPKPKDHIRILALGDSCTVGWGVDDDETYCSRLEVSLRETFQKREIEVVNCGVSGHNIKMASRILERFGPVLDPDLVLIGVTWNDLPFEAQTPDGRIVQTLSRTPARPKGSRFRILARHSELDLLLRRSRFLYGLTRLHLRIRYALGWRDHQLLWELALVEGKRSDTIEAAWDDVENSLRRVKSVADRQGTPLAIVIIPFRTQLTNDYPRARYQSMLRQIGERMQVPVVDPFPEFKLKRDRIDELFIPYDRIHPDAEGYKIIADSAHRFVVSSGLLSMQGAK